MTPDRWRRVQEVFAGATERGTELRETYLEEACSGDPELRAEVESLLSSLGREAPSFLESPAIEAVPGLSTSNPASSRALARGTYMGPYEILAPLGAGGMGEVYRAKDPRLGREVAIKVLPREVAADSERLRRFEKEARSASALNHPNIVTIYDIGQSAEGTSFIAMELVDGQTVRELLTRGALPTKRLLSIAVQVADGLAKAHEARIVHRDLKPENVMVTRDGLVKVLDFGLAKLTSTGSGSGEGSRLPTMTGTTPGVIVGTVGYMSPEQASGEAVDFRADQFSFGSILYEMAAGKRAFQKKTAVDTLGAILNEEPQSLAAVSPQSPTQLRWVIERCLAKEPRQRYSSTDDLARDLATLRDRLSEATSGSGAGLGIDPAPRRRLRWIVGGGLSLITAGIGFLLALNRSPAKPPQYTPITFNRGTIWNARFTPDGESVVYSASWEGKPGELYSTRLGNPESVPLGLPAAQLLSIARNGDMALLMNPVDRGTFWFGTLARAPLGGGAPRQVYKSVSDADWGPSGQLALLRWTEDGSTQILEYPAGNALYEVRGSTSPWMQSPRVSPDGRFVAFTEHPTAGELDGAVAIVDLAGRKTVISPGWTVVVVGGPVWTPHGDELWFTASGRTETPGTAIRAVSLSGKERVVLTGPGQFGLSDLSREGRLLMSRSVVRNATVFGGQGLERERDLSWSDTSDSSLTGLSADGKNLLFECGGDACLRGTDGGPVVRLGGGFPLGLSPDGNWVSTNAGSDVLTLIPTGPGGPRPLSFPGLKSVLGGPYPRWFPDSRHLVVSAVRGKEERRCFLVDIEGGVPRPVSPEGTGIGKGFDCWPSPDGKWVTARRGDDTLALYPVGPGEPRFVAGLVRNDRMVGWGADSRLLYLETLNPEWPIRVFRFDVETGRRELYKELAPSDPAGVEAPQGGIGVRMTPDGKFYVFDVRRFLSELYVVDRVR